MTAAPDDDPIQEVLIESSDGQARFGNREQKEFHERHPADIFIWKLAETSPTGWKLLPAEFYMTEGPRPGPADDHFVVHPETGGRTVTARLTDEQRTSGKPGDRRTYRYTLQLWIDGKHASDIDPEIEFIWP
jgi:hypothetical protein